MKLSRTMDTADKSSHMSAGPYQLVAGVLAKTEDGQSRVQAVALFICLPLPSQSRLRFASFTLSIHQPSPPPPPSRASILISWLKHMDDMDTVGRYGTVALVRKLTFESVTSYPVDDERTTFGR